MTTNAHLNHVIPKEVTYTTDETKGVLHGLARQFVEGFQRGEAGFLVAVPPPPRGRRPPLPVALLLQHLSLLVLLQQLYEAP